MGNCSSIVKTRRHKINLYPLHSILENQFIYNRNLVGHIIHYAWGGGVHLEGTGAKIIDLIWPQHQKNNTLPIN